MFYAFILICSLQPGAIPPCIEMEDTLGPYESRDLCIDRVNEMVELVPQMFNPPYNIKYKCTGENITKGIST